MNSFNNIVKIKYEKNQKDIVSLLEYIIFEDDRNQQKYLVFKFQNNVNQYLNEFKFEISQYDEENNLIAKSVISHGGFIAKENEVFVPNCKLQVEKECVKIQAKLLLARYERMLWENGNYTPIPYTASEFRNDYYRPVPEKPTKSKKLIKAEQKAEYKQFKKLQKAFNKRKNLSVKSIINRNKTKFPQVLSSILAVLLVIYVGVATYTQKMSSSTYFDGTYDYTVLSDGVYITDYEGSADIVILPTTYTVGEEELTIVGIGENAFARSNIQTIIFTQNTTIAAGAFKNCRSLENIYGAEYVTSIGEGAFKNCTSLIKVNFENINLVPSYAFEGCKNLTEVLVPNAVIEYAAFKDSKNLKTLDCQMVVSNNPLYSIFGEEKSYSNYELNNVIIGQFSYPADFTDGLKSITYIKFKVERPVFEFGALSGASIYGYINNGSLEILNGKVISVKDKTDITLPDNIDLDEAIFLLSSFAKEIKTLRIDYSGTKVLTKEHLELFSNLETIYISKKTKVSQDLLTYNYRVKKVGYSLDNIYSISLPSNVETLVLFDTTIMTTSNISRINNAYFVENLVIEDTVLTYSGKVLSSFTNLNSLVMPNYFNNNYQKDLSTTMGVTYNLSSLTITNKVDNNSLYLSVSNFGSLYEVNLEDLEITTLGLSINNCYSLQTITLSESIEKIATTLVSNSGISSLVIPSSVKSISYPLIGDGCNNLAYVEVPFIGNNNDKNCSYSEFNKSYYSTTTLKVTTKMNGDIENMFKDCYQLQSLEINVKTLPSVLSMFGFENIVLNKFIVTCDKISNSTFLGATINEIYVKECTAIVAESFKQVEDLRVLYLPSTKIAEMINYDALFSANNPRVYINGSMPKEAKNYKDRIVENYSYDNFDNK